VKFGVTLPTGPARESRVKTNPSNLQLGKRKQRITRLSKAAQVAFILFAAIMGWQLYRKMQIDRLYAKSAAPMGLAFASSDEAENAVTELASYGGSHVTQLLLTVALSENQFNGEVRTIAIERLKTRGGAEEAAALSTLLQPHQSINMRNVVAQAIDGMPCNDRCVSSILHYLERIYSGEQNDEDMKWTYLVEVSKEFPRPTFSKEQQKIYETLDKILKREHRVTLAVLIRIYGLEAGFPSPFVLDLVSRLQLNESCPYLTRAIRARVAQAPRDEKLSEAFKALACANSN